MTSLYIVTQREMRCLHKPAPLEAYINTAHDLCGRLYITSTRTLFNWHRKRARARAYFAIATLNQPRSVTHHQLEHIYMRCSTAHIVDAARTPQNIDLLSDVQAAAGYMY